MPEVCNICGSLLENSPQDRPGAPRVLGPRESPTRGVASSRRDSGGSDGVWSRFGVKGQAVGFWLACYGTGTVLGHVWNLL